jgi:hypothetical protein
VSLCIQDRTSKPETRSWDPTLDLDRALPPLPDRNPARSLALFIAPVVAMVARLVLSRQPFQGKGLGGQLILAARRRCVLTATEVGGVALLIDAKNERVAKWYSTYGAIPLVDAPLSLLLPLATVQKALESAGKL